MISRYPSNGFVFYFNIHFVLLSKPSFVVMDKQLYRSVPPAVSIKPIFPFVQCSLNGLIINLKQALCFPRCNFNADPCFVVRSVDIIADLLTQHILLLTHSPHNFAIRQSHEVCICFACKCPHDNRLTFVPPATPFIVTSKRMSVDFSMRLIVG